MDPGAVPGGSTIIYGIALLGADVMGPKQDRHAQ